MAPAAEEGGGAALGVEDMPDDMQVGHAKDMSRLWISVVGHPSRLTHLSRNRGNACHHAVYV